MYCRINDLKNKIVINVRDGSRLGYMWDAEVETADAAVSAIVIRGRWRLFGLLGREEDITVNWSDIELIGEDAILVNHPLPPRDRKEGEKKHGLFHILTEE